MIEAKLLLNFVFPLVIAVIGYLIHRLISKIDTDIRELKSGQSGLRQAFIRLETIFEEFLKSQVYPRTLVPLDQSRRRKVKKKSKT